MNVRLTSLLIATIGLLQTSCRSDDDLTYQPTKSGRGGSNGIFGRDSAEPNQSSGNINFGQGVDLVQDDVAVDYPTVEFYGTGILRSRDQNPIQVKNRQEMSKTQVTLHTLRFTSSDSTINKSVTKNAGSSIVFDRLSKEDLINRRDEDNFNLVDYLMYARIATNRSAQGAVKVTTYTTPMPIVVMPTTKRNYADLRNNPVNYTVQAQGPKGSYVINVTIQFEGDDGDIVRIRQTNAIPADGNGTLSDASPMPHSTLYYIDTRAKKVIKMETFNYYYNTHYKDKRDFYVRPFNLCSYTLKGDTDSYPCGG